MADITLLRPDDPPNSFPDPATALRNPDGLLAAGGDLSPARLLAAYSQGIFPWYEDGHPILWWSPDPRAILLPGQLHISRSLRRTLHSNRFRISVDLAFGSVIEACANIREATGTWITADMRLAYLTLHQLGHAHAVEIWQGSELVGGLYGLALGGIFFGESMFSKASDASKVALVGLVELMKVRGMGLIDCQVANPHLESLGSRLMPRQEFLLLVKALTAHPPTQAPTPLVWKKNPGPTAPLLEA